MVLNYVDFYSLLVLFVHSMCDVLFFSIDVILEYVIAATALVSHTPSATVALGVIVVIMFFQMGFCFYAVSDLKG